MVTKATRDVIDLNIREIFDGFKVNVPILPFDNYMDGVTIGGSNPTDGTFLDVVATNLTVRCRRKLRVR